MTLVDTSIWVDHLRQADTNLQRLLGRRNVLAHPFVLGEIAMGSLRQRARVINELRALPQAVPARDHEVIHLIESEHLYSLGIGYIDAHLLAAVRLTPGSLLWTRDKRLLAVARRWSLAFEASP